ncbi:MAG: NAD(P)H-binding protein [Ferruginibacter sp.]|nr:NAD(P)H-binding protein [Cytophagales bacterium]
MRKKIVVAGVTGNIGSRLASRLVELGHQVTGLGRNEARFKQMGLAGVDFREGELTDVSLLTALLKEADAAFLLIPPNATAPDNLAYQNATGEAIVQAVRDSGIRYVVNLSSQGADLEAGTGPVLGVHRQELRLNQVPGLNVLHLRPAYFMENLLANVPLVQRMGITGSAMRGDLSFPMIATADIAGAAAGIFDRLDFRGVVIRDLLGPRDYSMQETAQILGQAIGKPDLPYVQFSYEDGKQGMQQAGLSASMAELYTEMSRGANEQGIFNRVSRTPENTTPTALEQFTAAVKGAFVAVA